MRLRNGDQEKESRFDKLAAGEEAQWPNEPTASQAKGHNMVALSVASYGVVFMAGRDVARCVRGTGEADTVSGSLPGHGRPVLRLGRGVRINSDPENVRKVLLMLMLWTFEFAVRRSDRRTLSKSLEAGFAVVTLLRNIPVPECGAGATTYTWTSGSGSVPAGDAWRGPLAVEPRAGRV